MNSDLQKGHLVKWNDARGFGFIMPSSGKGEIFLHISEVRTTGRRPILGDVVFYKLGKGKNGKICAISVSIQGVVSTSKISSKNKAQPTNYKSSKNIFPKLIIGFIGVGLGIASVISLTQSQFSRLFNLPLNLPFVPKASSLVSTPKASSLVSTPKVNTPISTPKVNMPVSEPRVNTPVSEPTATILASEPIATIPVPEPIATNEPVVPQNCNIKGNISISTGNRLYHVAGMEDYEGTLIHLDKGERWFCSESEAIAAGWRRAPK